MESVTLPTLVLRKLPGINPTMHTNVQDKVATVKVVAKVTDENPTGYVVINKADMTDKHKLYEGADYVPPVEGQPEGQSQAVTDEQFNARVAEAVAAELARIKAAETAK